MGFTVTKQDALTLGWAKRNIAFNVALILCQKIGFKLSAKIALKTTKR
jgi:hypothetical protein